MKKRLLMSALAVLVVMSVCNVSYADDSSEFREAQAIKTECQGETMAPPHHKEFKGHHPSRAEMEAKKAEFEKRLNLTDEQKKKIENNKKKDREKMKPIMDKIHANKVKMNEIRNNESLSPEQKDKELAKTEKEMIDLRVKANELRKQNMESFEKILTPEQKTEFAKIKEEQKQMMEKRKKDFKDGKRGFRPEPPVRTPVEPKPLPVSQ